jgi:hypothetical protein
MWILGVSMDIKLGGEAHSSQFRRRFHLRRGSERCPLLAWAGRSLGLAAMVLDTTGRLTTISQQETGCSSCGATALRHSQILTFRFPAAHFVTDRNSL